MHLANSRDRGRSLPHCATDADVDRVAYGVVCRTGREKGTEEIGRWKTVNRLRLAVAGHGPAHRGGHNSDGDGSSVAGGDARSLKPRAVDPHVLLQSR